MLNVEGLTADDVWLQFLELVRNGRARLQPGRRESAYELLHVAMTVKNPRDRWVVSRHPSMNPAFAIAELIWILNGHNDASFLTYWNRRLPEFAGATPTYHGAYGFRLRRHFGLDQLEHAATVLRSAPSTRQVVLQVWDGASDLPLPDGIPRTEDIPCNLMSILKIRDGRLDWLQILRSNDLYLGLPHNFVQFMTLQEIIAGWVGVEVGEYHQVSDSLHIYESDYDIVMQSAQKPVSPNTDDLGHTMQASKPLLSRVDASARALTARELTPEALGQVLEEFTDPPAFRNWLIVLAAESARRRQWPHLCDEIIHSCTNPALIQMWDAWLGRVSQPRLTDVV